MTTHPVTQDIAQFFPATLELATTAIIVAVIVGVPLGVFAASRQGSRFDHVVRVCQPGGPVGAGVRAGAAVPAWCST